MSDLDRPAPPPGTARREWHAATIVAASVLVHVGAISAFVWSHRVEAARPPVETPIEVVQLPPEPAGSKERSKDEARKAETPKPQAATPKPPQPKPSKPKPPEPRPSPTKQAAKAPVPKPPAPKPPAPKATAARPSQSKQAQKAQARPQPQPEPQGNVAERMRQLIGAPMDATALPAMAAGGGSALDDAMPYQQLVLSLVAKQKREGRHNGIPGYAVVAFEIGDHGEVLTCELRKKSDDPAQDAEAMAMVHRAAPYPPPPPGATRQFAFGLRFQTM